MVGGGVIGVEYASMFAALGIAVTLVEKRDRVLDFLDREIVDELMHQMRNRNVTFRLGEAVGGLAIEENPRRAVLLLESGKRIVADTVLLSAGRVGATATLGLADAGLQADSRGRLTVDGQYRTGVPHIFAVGDVHGDIKLIAVAWAEGIQAAIHAFNEITSPYWLNEKRLKELQKKLLDNLEAVIVPDIRRLTDYRGDRFEFQWVYNQGEHLVEKNSRYRIPLD